MKNDIEKLRFPIGQYQAPANITKAQINAWIEELALLPSKIKEAVKGLDDKQLNTMYRSGGWSIRQVVHHLPDSHMNAYIRFKFAFTEDHPEIRPYHEELWAECEDAKNGPVDVSVDLLAALHRRWVLFLRSMNIQDFERSYQHPVHGNSPLKKVLGLYVWHGNHHLNHILVTRKINKW